MIALITLVIPSGGSAGPFDLYSDANGYTIPFATNISAATLQAGYTSNLVPNGTTIIRVTSIGACTNSVDTPINLITTTTTSSTSTSSTSTTSTSTTVAQACYVYELTATINNASFTAQLCYGGLTSGVLPFAGNTFTTPCIINTSLVLSGITAVTNSIDCTTTTTTSSSSTSTTSSTSTSTSTTTSTTTSSITSSTTTTTTTCPNCIPEDVTIGSQIWTGCNLNVTTYRNGNTIPQVTDPTAWASLTTGAWCYYNNDPLTEPIYGKLYNWHAVNDPRGLAPVGYHIPSQAEWDTLVAFLGGEFVAGGFMKETGLCHWKTPNTGATNSSGFSALPGGFRVTGGSFFSIGEVGWWWSSSTSGLPNAFGRTLGYNQPSIAINISNKKAGFSIRLIKD
jgi:uncharacterized protein (TIGR02145 family)